jgi:hypothetical protein
MSLVEETPPPIDGLLSTAAAVAPPGFYTEDHTAAILHTPKSTLRTWRARRQGPPCVKVGRSIFYSAKSLNEWLLKREKNFDDRRRGRQRGRAA